MSEAKKLIQILINDANTNLTTADEIQYVKECADAMMAVRKENLKGEKRATTQSEKLKKEVLNFFNVSLTKKSSVSSLLHY
jgi:hypothetical protein